MWLLRTPGGLFLYSAFFEFPSVIANDLFYWFVVFSVRYVFISLSLKNDIPVRQLTLHFLDTPHFQIDVSMYSKVSASSLLGK